MYLNIYKVAGSTYANKYSSDENSYSLSLVDMCHTPLLT